ncbi:MAG: hypothetical protein QOF56_99 [Acidobacteriaceae bacterium]|nr:hypothetical protein [Acidobacteriaceae bacterium]
MESRQILLLPDGRKRAEMTDFPVGGEQRETFYQRGGSNDSIGWIFRICRWKQSCPDTDARVDRKDNKSALYLG